MPALSLPSPVGTLTLFEADGAIARLRWQGGAADHTPLLDEAAAQLAAYFEGRLRVFDLPLAPEGPAMQRRFCAAMAAIPYGETRTYGEMAGALDIPAQAAGQLCGGNPVPVLIPCHRVLGASGLGGFSAPGGVETKVALPRLEGAAGLLI